MNRKMGLRQPCQIAIAAAGPHYCSSWIARLRSLHTVHKCSTLHQRPESFHMLFAEGLSGAYSLLPSCQFVYPLSQANTLPDKILCTASQWFLHFLGKPCSSFHGLPTLVNRHNSIISLSLSRSLVALECVSLTNIPCLNDIFHLYRSNLPVSIIYK